MNQKTKKALGQAKRLEAENIPTGEELKAENSEFLNEADELQKELEALMPPELRGKKGSKSKA